MGEGMNEQLTAANFLVGLCLLLLFCLQNISQKDNGLIRMYRRALFKPLHEHKSWGSVAFR